MKGFFRWFRSSAKMKRWMLLILIGMLIAFYGVAKVLEGDGIGRLDFLPLAKYISCFVTGFILVIVGIIHIQKRTLELLVQETDERIEDENVTVNSLIYNKKIYDQGPKIVAIGGGTGLNSVLKGLKKYTDNLTAIVTVSDYGEIIPESRRILKTMPLDDIKESIVALANNEEAMEQFMNYEFSEGSLKDLSLGDISLLGMKNFSGEFAKSVKQAGEIFKITGNVLPVTLEPINICAELEDGTVIESRDKIPEIVNMKTSKISRIFINPTNCKVAPGVLDAIQEADAIVIGPGSLYTNVIPNLLVQGVAKAVRESKAFKIYVSNLMTEQGQTDNYTLSDHIKAIIDHAGKGVIDYCIYDTGELIPEYIRKYNMKGQDLVEIDTAKAKEEGIYLMQREISHVEDDLIRHNPEAIAASIIQLICDDLKFKDMQNDTKYVLLNDRLKNAKKTLKESSRNDNFRKTKKNKEKGKSKFSQKYKDRIESIKESDIKMKVKEGMQLDEAEKETNGEKDIRENKKSNKKLTNRQEESTTKENKKNKVKKNNDIAKKANKVSMSKEKIEELEEEEKEKFLETINKIRTEENKDK